MKTYIARTASGVAGFAGVCACLLLLSGSEASGAGLDQSAPCGGRLFWVNSSGFGAPEGIHSSDPDGGDVHRVGDAGQVFGLAIDPVDRKLYWTDALYDGVYRSNLDGSDREVIVPYDDIYANPLGIGLDSQARRLYWSSLSGLSSSDLDGSNSVSLLPPFTGDYTGIVVDTSTSTLYLGNQSLPGVSRANLDGSALTPLVVGTTARGLAVDFTSQKLFWPEWIHPGGSTGVRRANLDGSADEVHAGPFPDYSLSGIAVDPFGRKVYWGGFLQGGRILRSNLDGTDVEEIVPLAGILGGLAFLPAADTDADRTCDAQDACPASSHSTTVHVGVCDSDVPNRVVDAGCNIQDQLAACAQVGGSPGRFFSCVARVTNDLMREGSLSGIEAGRIRRCAAGSRIQSAPPSGVLHP